MINGVVFLSFAAIRKLKVTSLPKLNFKTFGMTHLGKNAGSATEPSKEAFFFSIP